MAMASILLGFVSAFLSFALGLLAGHGFWVAAGFYVLGGFAGVASVIALVALRSFTLTLKTRDVGPATAQG